METVQIDMLVYLNPRINRENPVHGLYNTKFSRWNCHGGS